jgi:ATP-dependent Clp protease ATP-binding subunit ClpB
MEALRANFRPEFLNRIDEIVIFKALTREQIGEIVEIQLAGIAKRLRERQIDIQVTPAAREWLGNRGYDPVFGARPLKRLLQKEVLDSLAKKVLSGEVHDGETVTIDAEGGKLVFHANLSHAPLVA